MVIDIDSFLDKFEVDIKDNDKVPKISLDFQKDVEDRLLDLKNSSNGQNLGVLTDIYNEVKGFDEDLPSKFFGIEGSAGNVLTELGKKYSQEFLNINKINKDFINNKIQEGLQLVDDMLKINDFSKVFLAFKQIINDFESFPKIFMKEKIFLGEKLHLKEINIYFLFDKYKKGKIEDIKTNLKNSITTLNKFLNKGSGIADLEKEIICFRDLIDSIPDILISSLYLEKGFALKFLIKSENFLIGRYEEDFKYKENLIHKLKDKFHTGYVEKNLNEVLLIYNEILVVFKSIPDFFFERKMEIYNDINKLFDKVNKLILGNNVMLFLGSYQYGQKIEGIREYLRNAKESGIYNIDSLDKVKIQIDSLPTRFSFEKEEFLNDINYFLSLSKKHSILSSNKIASNKIAEVKNVIINKKPKNSVSKKLLNLDFEHDKFNMKKHKRVLIKINSLFEELKKTNSLENLTKIKGEIVFYLKILPTNKSVKLSILKKVREVINSKNIRQNGNN